MLRATMTEPGRIEYSEVEKPELDRDDQVLVRMERIGVCGSDIHVYHGTHPYTGYPIVQGHEVSGVIEEAGAESGFDKGQKVTIQPQVVCGECYHCLHGDYHICESLKVMGFQTDGCGQEYFRVDADKVLSLPEGMSLDAGALIEPISVAVHALRRMGGAAGKKVVVLGAGTIGNLTAQCARAMEADAVMVTDISDYKIEKAHECGIDPAVNTRTADLGEAIEEHFGPDRADLIMECVGAQACIDHAIQYARKGTT
ncbi:MAG: zinc-dependent alcohol dehydrogenase, partial [Candidatus Sumerlaeota bacterium]